MEEAQQSAALNPGSRDEAQIIAERRLRGLARHFAVYLVAVIAMAAANFWFFPERLYVVFPAVLWGAPLSLHVAYAMGLFDIFKKAPK